MFGIQHILYILPALFAAKAAVVGQGQTDVYWKAAHGWDGTVLDPLAIGTPSDKANMTRLYAELEIEPHSIEKRALGGVCICEDSNWEGKCGYAVQKLYICINLGTDWDRKISSIGPDEGTRIAAYINFDCELVFVNDIEVYFYPGVTNMGVYNDQLRSFLLYAYP